MKFDAKPALRDHEDAAGISLRAWAVLALLDFLTQALLYHGMHRPGATFGEYGMMNAALGIVGLLAVPVVALHQAFRLFFARATNTRLDHLRDSAITITETFAWVWAACCFLLIVLPLPLPFIPRFGLQILTLLNVLLALGGAVSACICHQAGHRTRWVRLLTAAAITRLFLGGFLASWQPWAETGIAAFLVASFVTLTPALQPREIDWTTRLKACFSALDREFLLFTAATICAYLGIYLFINADRIAAVAWVDNLPQTPASTSVYLGAGEQRNIDDYQATGLLARGLLWGTQPLLWMLYAERSRLGKSTAASLRYFWIYLGALVAGAFLFGCLAHRNAPVTWFIPTAGQFSPTFAADILPLGILQGLAIFSLASRRYPECFTIGGCSLGYALLLACYGRRPDVMLPYMFGAAMISLMIVLFVGVVRWGRKQP